MPGKEKKLIGVTLYPVVMPHRHRPPRFDA